MAVKVRCPNCSKELNAPEKLIGRLAACPRCSTQFPVTVQDPAAASATSAPSNVGPDSASYYPPGQEPPGAAQQPVGSSSLTAAQSVPLPPSPAPPGPRHPSPPSRPAAAPPLPPNDQPIQPPQAPSAAGLAGHRPAAAGNQRAGRPASPAAPLRPPTHRVAKSARFVSGGATTSRIRLGADGRLPELVVQEGKKAEPSAQEQPSSRPMLLAVALCLSAAFSVLLLFVDTETKQTRSATKAAARKQLEKYYIGTQPPFLPYQKLLRQALWASNHGDERTARRLYRRVLDMIHSEDKTESIGLTGPKAAVAPPTDRHLEKQLSILLSEQ